MPLPSGDQPWPPKPHVSILDTLATWSAWYEGTPDALRSVYASKNVARIGDREGGIRQKLQRWWWGRTIDETKQRPDQSHVPIAADLARASADMLYVEPPQITCTAKAAQPVAGVTPKTNVTQDRVDAYLPDLHAALSNGAELGAILGGRYHRVTWDKALDDQPFVTTVDADAAIPEFRWGRLVAVTFWHELETSKSGAVTRHLERHEFDAEGNGLILHGLYEGTSTSLGRARPLDEHPVTAPLTTLVDENGALKEGRTKGLCVVYIPNQLPQRRWRKHPVGRNLGRSDLDGVEPLMDNLDEAYSSLMRDIRLGKGRIIVPAFMLKDNGPGMGATFDIDREVYDPLNIPDPAEGQAQITIQQFAIRVEEHLTAIADLVRRIVHTAGYSNATFGDGTDEGGAITATEVHARERRTYRTRARKLRNEHAGITELIRKMLSIDNAIFGTAGIDSDVDITVTFADGVEDTQLNLAQTALALSTARAASIETLVRTVNPDWDDTAVLDEVAKILNEEPVTDPFTIGG